jgi:hypothetical protein
MRQNNVFIIYMRKYYGLFEFGHIRIEKFLDMSQSAVEVGFFSLIIASIFNKFSFALEVNDPKIVIFVKMLIEMIIIIILIYYIRKVTNIIPFMFHYTDKYKVDWKSKDGETKIGTTVAFALIFLTLVTKTKEKITYLSKYIQNNVL